MSNRSRYRPLRLLNLIWVAPICLAAIYAARFLGSFFVCGITGCSIATVTASDAAFTLFFAAVASVVVLLTVAMAPWGTRAGMRWLVAALAASGAGAVAIVWVVFDFLTDQVNLLL